MAGTEKLAELKELLNKREAFREAELVAQQAKTAALTAHQRYWIAKTRVEDAKHSAFELEQRYRETMKRYCQLKDVADLEHKKSKEAAELAFKAANQLSVLEDPYSDLSQLLDSIN